MAGWVRRRNGDEIDVAKATGTVAGSPLQPSATRAPPNISSRVINDNCWAYHTYTDRPSAHLPPHHKQLLELRPGSGVAINCSSGAATTLLFCKKCVQGAFPACRLLANGMIVAVMVDLLRKRRISTIFAYCARKSSQEGPVRELIEAPYFERVG